MVTNMKDYVSLEDDDDNADFRYSFRDNLITQFKQVLYGKNFIHQDQGKCDDSLEKRNKFWLNYVVNEGGPIPKIDYD